MFSSLLKRIWAEHVAGVGVAAGDALASISITASTIKTQMIAEEGKKRRLNMANLMGRYQPVLLAVEEARHQKLIADDKQDEIGPEILVVEDGIERSNVRGVAKPKMLSKEVEEIGIFTCKEDCESMKEIGIFTCKEDCESMKEIGIFTCKEDCETKKDISVFTRKANGGIIKKGLKGEIKPQPVFQSDQKVESIELLEEGLTSKEISKDIRDLEILLRACMMKRLEGSINVVGDEEDSFSQKTSDVVSTAEIYKEDNVTVGVFVAKEDFDPGKCMSIGQEFPALGLAPRRVRGARSRCSRTRRTEQSRSIVQSNGETGRRCQRVKRISWTASRVRRRTRNAKLKTRGRQSTPLNRREKYVRQIGEVHAIVPRRKKATATSTDTMFNFRNLDEDNQERIIALQEDEIAKKEEVWGRMKAAAWGNLHTLVPVSVEERRGSLVPLTGCKCEGADTTQVTDVNHNVVGPHMAVVVMDRRKHGAMGADLGIGQAGEGAAHLPECKKLCDEEDRLLQEEALKREAVRRAETAKEYTTRVENTKKLLAEVNWASSIPKEEGRASLARKARRAEAERVATSRTKIDRARRCIFALQKLKMELPTTNGSSGPQGAQLGGSEPFNALWGQEKEEDGALNVHNEMRVLIRRDNLTAMQRKLAKNAVKMKAVVDAKGRNM